MHVWLEFSQSLIRNTQLTSNHTSHTSELHKDKSSTGMVNVYLPKAWIYLLSFGPWQGYHLPSRGQQIELKAFSGWPGSRPCCIGNALQHRLNGDTLQTHKGCRLGRPSLTPSFQPDNTKQPDESVGDEFGCQPHRMTTVERKH
jgi:hypothetical protein